MAIPPISPSSDLYTVITTTWFGKAAKKAATIITNKASNIYNTHRHILEKNEKASTAKRKERYKRAELCFASDVLHTLTQRLRSPEVAKKASPIEEQKAAHTMASLVSNYGNQLRYVNEKYEEEKKAMDERIRTAEEAADVSRNQSSFALR